MPRRTDEELLRAVGARIRQLREARGLTQQALAERIDLGQFTYSRYETGRRSPPISVLSRVAEALGVPLAALFEEPDESSGEPGRDEWLWLWEQLGAKGREIVLATARSALPDATE
jgi:transcriptional regulator with XRE-family HTH domain